MKLKLTILFVLGLVIFPLTACSQDTGVETAVTEAQAVSNIKVEAEAPQMTTSYETLVDEQGAVSVAVTPLNLEDTTAEMVAFEVAMDTHSVDLSMDLASSATLTTDNGREVQPSLWDAKPGGHHVTGILYFPAVVDAKMVLTGASQLTLIIRDVDAPVRNFSWQLDE